MSSCYFMSQKNNVFDAFDDQIDAKNIFEAFDTGTRVSILLKILILT